MHRQIFAILSALLLALLQAMPAAAETADDTEFAQLRQEHPEAAIAVLDVTVLRDGKNACAPTVVLKSTTQTKMMSVAKPGGGFLHMTLTGYGGMKALEPTIWTIIALECAIHYNGAIAQFRLEAGEIVNLGHLVVDVLTIRPKGLFQRAIFRTRAKVEDIDSETSAALKERAPATFAKAKRRYLTVNSKFKWFDTPPAPLQ